MRTNSVIRMSDVVDNKDAHQRANRQYHIVYISTSTGGLIPCLLTDDDISKGIDRAGRNAEDLIKLNVLQRLYHKLLNLLT